MMQMRSRNLISHFCCSLHLRFVLRLFYWWFRSSGNPKNPHWKKTIIQHKIQKQMGKRWEIEVSASRIDPRQINDPPLFMKTPPLNKNFEVSRYQASVCLGNHLGVEATLLYHRLWDFRLHGTVLEMGLVVLDPVFRNWWRQGLRTLWTIWGFKLNIKHAHIPKWPTCLSKPNKNFFEIFYKNTKNT